VRGEFTDEVSGATVDFRNVLGEIYFPHRAKFLKPKINKSNFLLFLPLLYEVILFSSHCSDMLLNFVMTVRIQVHSLLEMNVLIVNCVVQSVRFKYKTIL
jgi:hypothetical protein